MAGSIVQSRNSATFIGGSSISLAFVSNNTEGNNLWIVGHTGSQAVGFNAPTDTRSNTYSAIVDDLLDTANNNRVGHWQVQNCGGGANTVTVNLTTSEVYTGIWIVEVAGCQNAAFTGHNKQHQDNPGTGTDAISSLAATPAGTAFMLGLSLRDGGGDNSTVPGLGTGFSDSGEGGGWDFGDGAGVRGRVEYKAGVTGSAAATFTYPGPSSLNTNTVMIQLLENQATILALLGQACL
jgi:hypothetical protein